MRRALLFCAAIAFAIACGDNITEPIPDRTPTVNKPLFATTTTEDGLSISTDKDDYQPGDVVHFTGYGWQPGDVLDIVLTDDPQTHDPHTWTVNVGADGMFHDSTYVVDEGDLNVTFTLVATSRATARSLTVVFTDNIPPGSISVTLNTLASVTVPPGETISLAVTARVSSNNPQNSPTSWKSTGWVLLPNPATTEPAGKLANCVDTPNVNGTAGNGTDATATFNITAPTNPGTYDLWVALSDADGTGVAACGGPGALSQKKAFPSSVIVLVVDQTAPTVTINQAAGQADPTNASPINFTVVFSEPVVGFAANDVSFTGSTVGGTLVANVTSTGPTTYNVAVTGMTGTGTVVASIPAGAAVDAANNLSTASTSTDNSVTFDATAPGVTINQAAGQADPTNSKPINFTVVFSKPVTGFDAGEVDLSASTVVGTLTPVVTGGPSTYNVAISGTFGDGLVIASIPGDVAQDASGNGNAASTSTDNQVTYDGTPPTVTINQAAGQADPTSGSTINFTVLFSENVADFATGDVTLSGTANATTATVTGSGTTYNVAVSGMTGDGDVIASIAGGVAHDAAGNGNNASTSTDNTVVYDKTPPAVSCGAADGNWHATDVSIACTASDAPAGLANPADASFSLTTSVLDNTETNNALTNSRDIFDNAGNKATAGPISGNKVDKKAPTVALTCPADLVILNASANANWTATDGGSGVTPSGTVPLVTSSIGSKTASVTVQDNVGNSNSSSCGYTVGYSFSGFFAPVDRPNTMNVSKVGQAIPLKWRLTDAAGNGIPGVTGVTVQAYDLSCSLGSTTDVVEEYAGNSGLQDLGDGYYQFNWKTPNSYLNSCKKIALTFGTGGLGYTEKPSAYFTFKK